MSTWRVKVGHGLIVNEVASAQKVLEGLRDGEWEPEDEVRGPGDPEWVAIADHPTLADAVAEMGPPPAAHGDETHLDMNPLIDVALVLLVFFILTTSYASLKRTIDVPAPSDEAKAPAPKEPDIENRVFHVSCWMEDGKPTIKIEDKIVDQKVLDKEMKEFVRLTGRKELLLEVDGRVPWGVEASIHDAAKAADILQIYRKNKKQ